MKRTFTKQGTMSFLAGVLLFGIGLLSSTSANAQLVWMQTDQALPVLQTEVTDYQDVLRAGTPGTPTYEDALRHAHYFKAIYRQAAAGTSVEQAARNSLDIFKETLNPGEGFTTAHGSGVVATKVQKDQLLQDAIDLLTL